MFRQGKNALQCREIFINAKMVPSEMKGRGTNYFQLPVKMARECILSSRKESLIEYEYRIRM